MTKLNIAVCGPEPEATVDLRETIGLGLVDYNLAYIDNPSAYMQEISGLVLDSKSADWVLLWTATERRRRMFELAHRESDDTVVLSDSFALDEAAQQFLHLSNSLREAELRSKLLASNGQAIATEDDVMLVLSQSVAQVLFSQSEQEAATFWHFAYYKPPVLATDLSRVYDELLKDDPILKQKVKLLPSDIGEAKDFLREEAAVWIGALQEEQQTQ